jgi:hypothetical protein
MNPPSPPAPGWFQRQFFRAHVLKEAVLYRWSPHSLSSRKHLSDLRGSLRGRRCFILGNGPSLRQTDLKLLKDEFTFGLNRVYLLFPELGFATTYLVAVNELVLEQCASEIVAQPSHKFLPWAMRRMLPESPPADLTLIQTQGLRPGFSRDARGAMWQGATVTFVAMQLAYHMGFQEVILIGVDHSFATQGKPHETVVSQGDDPNHFAPDYFGKGFRWQLPDLESSERAYRLARRAFETDGRTILDATLGGKLTVFPKVEYSSLFR